jgi:hypothetical protein
MQKASSSNGFFYCFAHNLILNFEWSVFALILLALHLFNGIPLWIPLIGAGVWLAVALTLTFLSMWSIVRRPSKPSPSVGEEIPAMEEEEVEGKAEGKAETGEETCKVNTPDSFQQVISVIGAFGQLIDKVANLANQPNSGKEESTTNQSEDKEFEEL